MAAPSSGPSGGIPRLLYSVRESAVRAPLLGPEGGEHMGEYREYGLSPPGSGSNSDSRPRHFSDALNPRLESASDDDDWERGSPMESRGVGELPHRYRPAGYRQPAVDESGTMITARSVVNRSTEIPGFQEFVPYLRDSNRTKYEEAALFAKEGEDNNKFASHPNGRYSKIAYHLVHHPIIYTIDFLASFFLLGLAIIEEPSWIPYPANYKGVVIGVHSTLELLLLSIIGFNIMLRVIWMKPRTFLRQRAMIASIILVVMYIEAMVVLIYQRNHFRITRSLRIIFFVDSYILHGVRRVLRQIMQCLKPILDVMILLFFMIAIFALMAYYLFAKTDPTYFDSYLKSFVSLFITLTTANHPDVYMEAYVRNHSSPLFFAAYLFVTLYFFSNVLLAVVYAHFNDEEKNKFKKLFLHKREALKLAFYILAKDGEGVSYHDFLLFMLQYRPRIPEYQVMCIFKGLQTEQHEFLCLEDFLNLYEIQNLKWKQVKRNGVLVQWYDHFPPQIKPFFYGLHRMIQFKYFNSIIAFIVILNALFLLLYTLITSFFCGIDGANVVNHVNKNLLPYCADRFATGRDVIAGSFIFTSIYMLELTIRLLAVGPVEYFRKWWNRFDFLLIIGSFIALCIEADAGNSSHEFLQYLIVIRPLKLLRLLRLRRRYYDIMSTVFILGHRLMSVLLLLFVIFYFYAIIGMEVFQGKVFVGCCSKALYGVVGEYKSNASLPSSDSYWLNNFDNIYQSYVILYEEMVVNNWFVQMEGFVSETSIAARVFFIAFWCTTTICVSVVIAYIVDAFVFRIQSSEKRKRCNIHSDLFECNCHQFRKKKVEVILSGKEINQIKYETTLLQETSRKRKASCCRTGSLNLCVRNLSRIDFDLIPSREVFFTGKRLRTREDVHLQMYRSELQDWINEREDHLKRLQHDPPKQKPIKTVVWLKIKELLLFLLE